MNILGIESSCDETAASVVQDGYYLKGNVVASSMDIHKLYGGVVPEIAARSHLEAIMPVIDQALERAKCNWDDIDAIAVTYGAGLGGSLLIGVLAARTMAIVKNKPIIGVNHVEAHIYASFLTKSDDPSYTFPEKQPSFPFLGVIVSGGHTQLVLFKDHGDYEVLGKTKDDAIGEAFDKVAKILGLPYPGGPAVSELAKQGDKNALLLPKPYMADYDFSYSGLKTAVLRRAQAEIGESYDFPSIKLASRLSEAQKANIAASFEFTAAAMVTEKVKLAWEQYEPTVIVVAGGAAANSELRSQLDRLFKIGDKVIFPSIKLCTDNGAMIATLGYYRYKANAISDPYKLDINSNLVM
jgi:N6-L-threonylcarbamoyladenine synthase